MIRRSDIHDTHVLIFGRFDTPTYYLNSFLRKHVASCVVVTTSMQVHESLSLVRIERKGRKAISVRIPQIDDLFPRNSFVPRVRSLQMLVNYLFIAFYVFQYMVFHNHHDVVIGVGPLNAAFAVLYRVLHPTAKAVYYAEDRIELTFRDLFSRLTYFTDSVARSQCDALWVMSEQYKNEIGDRYPCFFVPIPIERHIGRSQNEHDGKRIMFLGAIVPEQGYDMLYRVFTRLLRYYPTLKLTLIGSGDRAQRFVEEYSRDGYGGSIEYVGYINDQKKLQSIVSQADIGICLYNPAIYKNLAYGQSSKITTYLTCGVPVIVTGSGDNTPSLARYVKQYASGYVVRYDEEEIYRSIRALLKSPKLLNQMKKNTKILAKVFDKTSHYTHAMDSLLAIRRKRRPPPSLSRMDELLCFLSLHVPGSYQWLIRKALGRAPKNVLDVGCGNGAFMYVATKGLYHHITGVDIFAPSIIRARKTGVYERVIQKDIRTMSFPKKSFDIVISLFVLEHLQKKDGDKMLKEMERLAKEKVIVVVPMGACEQHAYEGNIHQEHLSTWYAEEFLKRGYEVVGQGLNIYDRNPVLRKLLVSIGPLNHLFFLVHILMHPFISKHYVYARHLICVKRMK